MSIVSYSGSRYATSRPANTIGDMGSALAGVGVYPGALPSGFSYTSDYGNYEYTDGSIMCWIPAFYYKIAADNTISIKAESAYVDEAAANADGYALHRAFKDGGETKRGFFIDKYKCSNKGGTASSIKNGDPLSTHEDHNPINDLDGGPSNAYYGTIDAAKTRGSQFQVASMFQRSALAMLAMAHGQAATSADYCAWYDAGGSTNFPKGCNDDALGDTDDAEISYTGDGYSNAPKTGSGTPFAKTTHNGQPTGVADMNGGMWEVQLGLTRDSGNNDFYALKESIAVADLASGSGSGNDAWGDAAHLANLYDVLTATHITDAQSWSRFGNGANQVLDEAVSGNGYALTGLGLPKDASAFSSGGTNLFGTDGLYERHRADLCVISGGAWSHGSLAGAWCAPLYSHRGNSTHATGFRAACYAD